MFEQFIGVKPVEERHRFDAGRLAQFLRGKIDDWRGELRVEQCEGIGRCGERQAVERHPFSHGVPLALFGVMGVMVMGS